MVSKRFKSGKPNHFGRSYGNLNALRRELSLRRPAN
ncbi:hypothetical protein RV134_270377 [Roseovarius sp. EC-HK134]|nr:hypothetical protein RV134_270377 [Roseovarius sp. EC-HK134]